MNDCSNAEIRDHLPDLVHERLDANVRAVVVAHVSACADCRDELELLRSVHKALIAQTPRVDIAYVAGALPTPKPAAPRARVQPARPRWSDWRIAAAVTVLVAGGSSLAVLRRTPATGADPRAQITDSTPTRSVVPVAPESAMTAQATVTPSNPIPTATVAATEESEDGIDGRFGGLSDEQMQALLAEIDRLQAVPVTEPEPVTIRVDIKPNGAEESR